MQLLALDKDFKPVQYFTKYLNLQWVREYCKTGKFILKIRASDYKKSFAYIFAIERPETGIIQKIEYDEDIEGDFITLSGMFLESILSDKIIYPKFVGTGKIETSIRNCLNANKADIPLLTLGALNNYADEATFEKYGVDLSKAFYETLQTAEMTYRCRLDYLQNKIFFEVFRGKDLTQSQSTNPFVCFSKSFRNIANIKVDLDNSNYKNFIRVVANGDEPIVVDVDNSNGGYKKVAFLDQKSTKHYPDKQTLDEFKQTLKQKGEEKLLKYAEKNNFDFDVTQSNFKYLIDYDLGDKVDVMLENIGISLECRVVTVKEVFKENKHEITLELGDKKTTIFEKERLN